MYDPRWGDDPRDADPREADTPGRWGAAVAGATARAATSRHGILETLPDGPTGTVTLRSALVTRTCSRVTSICRAAPSVSVSGTVIAPTPCGARSPVRWPPSAPSASSPAATFATTTAAARTFVQATSATCASRG
jgi:hypothetical protein